MFFLKKIFVGLGFIMLISLGGLGTQSNSLFMQGVGFFGLLVGLVILYVFGRMIWKGLGCLPSFILLSLVVLFTMYALGFFNNGLSGVGSSALRFIGYNASNAQDSNAQASDQRAYSENFSDYQSQEISETEDAEDMNPNLFGATEGQDEVAVSRPQKKIVSAGLDKISRAVSTRQKEEPDPMPVVYGKVQVLSGDTLEMYGRKITLFGLDAPEINQTCADKYGRSYQCGYEALSWLKSWISEDAELECRIFKQDTKGNMLGVCSYGPYDIGAALVNAGWAVAYTRQSDIYAPYEVQAQEGRRGLWQGQFYKPWDWRKLQSRKAKIKVLKPKKRLEGIFG